MCRDHFNHGSSAPCSGNSRSRQESARNHLGQFASVAALNRAAAMAAVEPLPPARRHTAKVQRVVRVARVHLRNAAFGSFDHPSRNTSINPVDNYARERESPANPGLSWGSDQMNGGGEGTRTLGLYIANVALCQLSYTPGEPQNSRGLRGARRWSVQRAAARGTSKSSSSQAPG